MKGIAENCLVGLTAVIAFLLIFESQLVLPVWAQSFGRLHPMLLHFPIVLLLVGVLLEFFRYRPVNAANAFYQNFSGNFLLSGSLLAAVTVIMGLFLSQEEGYAGNTLFWHKWLGAGVFFLSAGVYFFRSTSRYQAPVAATGGGILLVVLVLAGHFGASLTHGDTYLLEPFMASRQPGEQVPLDQALVFADVIQPIFNQKCASCHNPEKLKGQLLLTTEAGIKKGGKTGKLFVAGNPEMSLLWQRIHLPLEEKKHMPPSGKSQLSPEEIALLSLWVQERADFTKKVIDLPAGDSLRRLAVARLEKSKAGEGYDFAGADEATIEKLNTDYRTVVPLAQGVPALSVSLYNREAYTVDQLKELAAIRKQIVSLNLNKLPVKDQDLKSISQFENLQKLNLNFTDVTTQGLGALSGLAHLKYLTLSGTRLDFPALKTRLRELKQLKSLAVWDAGLSGKEIAGLKQEFKNMEVLGGYINEGTSPLTLNPPQLANASTVFVGKVPLQLRHPIKGVEIRFTTDGTEPDSLHSPVFRAKTIIARPTTVRARAYKAGWRASSTVLYDFFQCTYQPDSLRLLYPLNSVHLAEGAETFFNKKLGTIGANNPAWANYWAGVRANDLGLMAEFKQPVTISSVGMHYMIEEDTGIFPPESVEVWGGQDQEHLTLLTRVSAPLPAQGDRPTLKSVVGNFDPARVRYLKILARPRQALPDWHRSKGNRALLLVDEMFIN